MRLERFKLDRQLSKEYSKSGMETKTTGNSERKQMKEFLDKMKKNKSQ